MENTAKTTSCLAIAEKKTHRPGGCVGIFFQLFDWNRRLAKKKLFSRKLLPPAQTKQATKKFKGCEKMQTSKVQLIADENRGGFPMVKKNGNRGNDFENKNETRVPGLVARLMGLESMPVVNRDKPKKTRVSVNEAKKFVEDLNLEKESVKIESRPLKLQKTGPSERKVMSRIGAEVLQYKSVLSRSRKHHHQLRLASPVKSPRLPSGRNVSRASRLIDVASRILEPGLQASNRAKSALTLPNSMHYSPNSTREIGIAPLKDYNSSESFMEQTSCKNCNNLLKVEVFNYNVDEQPYATPPLNLDYACASSQGSGRSKPTPSELPFQQERDEILRTNCDQPKSFLPLNNESPFQSSRQSSQPFKPRKNVSSVVIKRQNQSEDQMVRDRMPSRSKLNNLPSRRAPSSANTVGGGTKNFVALNRSLNGCSRDKLPTKVEAFKFGIERESFDGRENLSSQSKTSLRKRRTANVSSAQIESKDSVDSSAAKHQFSQCDKLSRTSSRLERKALSTKQSCAKSRLNGNRGDDKVCRRDNNIVSFSFSSQVMQKTRVASDKDETMANERKIPSQKASSFQGDAIGILEQKLKELTSQEDGDLASASPSKRSTAIILQELISALAAEQQVSVEGSTINMDATSCGETKRDGLTRMCKGGDHLSPGSVLEASFSSSSVDDSEGCKIPADSIDYSNNQSQLSEPDADLLDSATSLSKGKAGNEMVTELFSAITRMLQSYSLTGIRLTGSKLNHAKEVMFNTEISFGGGSNPLIVPLLIDELETLTGEMWTNSSDFSGSQDSKEVNHLRGFLFDCLIECLDFKYSRIYGSDRTPLVLNVRTVIQDVEKEMKKWTYFVGMMTDEIVEWEMSHSLGKWTDFSEEEFECGGEIDGDILKILVEEIVLDLWECRGCF